MTAALQIPGVMLRAEDLIALRRVMMAAATAPMLAALPGGFATRRKGHGLEVADMREYVAGDEIRHLDRGTTARTGRLHVRQFQQERDRICLLVADFRPSMFWGVRRAFRSVAAAEALAMIGWNVVETGGRVGLLALTPGEPVIVPARGRARGMLDVIGGLVQAHQAGLDDMTADRDGEAPLDQGLARADRLVPSGAELVIASGFDAMGAGLADRLDALARRRHPQLLLITDAVASALPKGRYPMRLRDGRRVRVHLGGGADEAAAEVQQVAGRPALILNAGDSIENTATRIVARFPAGQVA